MLLAPALAYNLVITLGLLNFAIGMGLALIAFAAWLTIDRRRLGLRLALFNAASIVLFFCHLAAFAALALLVALYEAPPRPGESRRGWAARAPFRRRLSADAASRCGPSRRRSIRA